eukprot:scaffold5787_cov179-Ochromonas_danica.AAC.5
MLWKGRQGPNTTWNPRNSKAGKGVTSCPRWTPPKEKRMKGPHGWKGWKTMGGAIRLMGDLRCTSVQVEIGLERSPILSLGILHPKINKIERIDNP